MSANDEHLPGIAKELMWLDRNLNAPAPFVGVCLGAQILARVLGSSVMLHPEGHVENGYTPIEPMAAGKDYFPSPLSHVYQWHKEGFDLPAGATSLARGCASFENQFFRYGDSAYGIQFHPEETLLMLKRWTIGGAHMLNMPGATPRDEQIANHAIYDPALGDWTEHFVDSVIAKAEMTRACAQRSAA